jgi:hypothetical protein
MRGGAFFVIAAGLAAQAAFAGTVSYTGTLASPEDSSNEFVVDMATAGTLALQTWGFGGGTNAAGTAIPAGGFDPFVGVFAGTGPTATLIDGTSDVLSNYGSYTGCPPAGTVVFGTDNLCGDVQMSFSLAAGEYTVLLTDADYIPTATFEVGGQLGDGFIDLTGGALQTCDGDDCITPTANWALDITTPNGPGASTPEPATVWFCGIGLMLLGVSCRRSRIMTTNANSAGRTK